MSNRVSLDNLSVEEELFNQFVSSTDCNSNIRLAKSKIPEIIYCELTPTQNDVLNMYYYQNLNQKQIATVLNRDQSTVSRNLKRAKSKIFRILRYIIE